MEGGVRSHEYALLVRDFPTEESQTRAVVMRDLTFEKFVSLLELEAMWFSRLGALQDKYECTNPQGVRAKVLALAKNRETVEKRLPPGMLDYLLKAVDQGRSESGRQMGAVNCWFLGQDESEMMWGEYGQEGKGVAIRSTVRRLASAFQITGDYALVSAVGRIHYVDFESHEMDSYDANNLLRVAFIKDKRYASEQEVRVVTLNSLHSGCLNPDGLPVVDHQPVFDPNGKGFYVKCRLQELVQAIIVGPNAQPHFFTLVKRLVNRYRLFVEVETSKLPAKH
jgi:hypothetical protein